MTVWVVRAGSNGEREEKALEEGLCFIGWGELPDLRQFSNKETLRVKLQEVNTKDKPGRIRNHSDQVWTFISKIKKGDIIALPLKDRPAIAFGEALGKYVYNERNPSDARHCHAVKWLGEPVLRSRFDQDLKYSFGASQTVFSIYRNNAEERIRKMLSQPASLDQAANDEDGIAEPAPNLLDSASQQISDYIGQKFKGRAMERLIEAILKAQGYETNLCPVGADGGVDILAGRGVMGFEQPRLCIQVKSGEGPVGRETLEQLQGVMHKFKADYGLLVAWGGFKSTVIQEARRNFFQIRLWNDQKIVEELQSVYEKLPAEIQAELPLQRTWVLVDEE